MCSMAKANEPRAFLIHGADRKRGKKVAVGGYIVGDNNRPGSVFLHSAPPITFSRNLIHAGIGRSFTTGLIGGSDKRNNRKSVAFLLDTAVSSLFSPSFPPFFPFHRISEQKAGMVLL